MENRKNPSLRYLKSDFQLMMAEAKTEEETVVGNWTNKILVRRSN